MFLCFLPTLEAPIQFYFIPNKKYGSFRWFWVPSQLHTTKTRPCGFSQSLWRNEILEKSDAFWSIHQKIRDFEEISIQTRSRSFCHITTCDPALESFFRELFDCNKNFNNISVFFGQVSTAAAAGSNIQRNTSNPWKSKY